MQILAPNELIFYQTLLFFPENGIIEIQKSSMLHIRYDLHSRVQFGAVLQGTYFLQIDLLFLFYNCINH